MGSPAFVAAAAPLALLVGIIRVPSGERWQRVTEEEVRTLAYDQLKLALPFDELFLYRFTE